VGLPCIRATGRPRPSSVRCIRPCSLSNRFCSHGHVRPNGHLTVVVASCVASSEPTSIVRGQRERYAFKEATSNEQPWTRGRELVAAVAMRAVDNRNRLRVCAGNGADPRILIRCRHLHFRHLYRLLSHPVLRYGSERSNGLRHESHPQQITHEWQCGAAMSPPIDTVG
jgi:hypothetical protein